MPAVERGDVAIGNHRESRIRERIAELESREPAIREKARRALVAIGEPAVPSLIQLLSHRKPHVRWEAAKALGRIADPLAATALVNALDDPDGDTRWVAAEAVIVLGREGLQPLLAGLLQHADSRSFCEGAHHICHVLSRRRGLGPILRPVLAALDEPQPAIAAPLAAYNALSRLRELC